MNSFEEEKYQQNDINIPEEEVVRNFTKWGYRGYHEKRSFQRGPFVEVVVTNARGHTISGAGETKEEAIEEIVEQIDRLLDEK